MGGAHSLARFLQARSSSSSSSSSFLASGGGVVKPVMVLPLREYVANAAHSAAVEGPRTMHALTISS